MVWLGTKKVAFIPTFRPRAIPPDFIPPDWDKLILRRVLNDPAPGTNIDRSFRAWLRAASSGRADIEPVVFPMETIDQQNVPPDVFEGKLGGSLRSQGFAHACIVMLGGDGAATNAGYWSRFVMVESTGKWIMEVIHGITGFKDLYPFNDDLDPADRVPGSFDLMSGMRLTHPTAYTKLGLGWADQASIVQYGGATVDYDLHFLSRAQPPPAGRVSAIRIGTGVPYVMIEARKKNDSFDGGVPTATSPIAGIDSEGVIAYRVQTPSALGERINRRLPVFMLTQTALKAGQSASLDNGIVLTVTGELSDGMGVRVENPLEHLINRTTPVRAARTASPPTSLVLPAVNVENVAYRSSDGHLHELWRDPRSIGTTDLTANARATAAKGNPFSYLDPTTNSVILLYRGTDDHVHSLYWSTGAVGHDALTGSVNAPKTAGNPVGWYTPDNVHHVVYRSGDNHLHELWWIGPGRVNDGDITKAANAVPASGDASCYFDPVRGTNIVCFRGTDGRIRSLYWNGGPVGQDDLSGTARTVAAAGDPTAYFSAADDTHHVTYVGTNGHVIQLLWANVAPVSGRDLTAETGGPGASGPVAAGFNPATNTHHVFYRAGDGSLHELWRRLGQAQVTHENLTAAYNAPKAADRPTSWVSTRSPHQHMAYRGTDGNIYELLW